MEPKGGQGNAGKRFSKQGRRPQEEHKCGEGTAAGGTVALYECEACLLSPRLLAYPLPACPQEKRKRDEGKATQGKNYVEEEKRRAREYGIVSGFD